MVSRFAKLDEQRGVLRLIFELNKSEQGLTRQEALKRLSELDVGSSAFYSSLKACLELGLAEVYESRAKGRIYKVTQLTKKGVGIAEKIQEIEKILGDV